MSCDCRKCLVLTYNNNDTVISKFDSVLGTSAYQYIVNVNALNDPTYRINIHIENQQLPNTDYTSIHRFTIIDNNSVCREATFALLANVNGVYYSGTFTDCYNDAKLVVDGSSVRTLSFGYLL